MAFSYQNAKALLIICTAKSNLKNGRMRQIYFFARDVRAEG
jgi:hypothetical protein